MCSEETKQKKILFRGLLAQLDLPVYRMRLITAREIVRFLKNDEDGFYQSEFLTWLAECVFESEVITGLSVLGLLPEEKRIDQTLVRSHIRKPSILSDVLLEKIYNTGTHFLTWTEQHSGTPSADFEPSDQFNEVCTRFVAPIYKTNFDEWERKTGFPFVNHWAWEFKNLFPLLGDHEGSPSYFYESSDRWEHTGTYHLRMADVLQSAYLRTISFAVSVWDMPLEFAAPLSANCIFLDFELAKVDAIEKPEIFNTDTISSLEQLQTEGILNECLKKVAIREDEILLAASFPINRSKLFSADFNITSVFIDGEPDIASIFESCFAFLPNSCMLHEWNFQDEFLTFMAMYDKAEGFAPAAFKIYPECYPRLQCEVIMCGVFTPSPRLMEARPEVEYLPNEMLFKVNEEIIARWVYWYDNWRPCHLRHLSAGVGSALLIKRDVLNRVLQNLSSPLALAGEVKYRHRDKEYGEYTEGVIYSDLIEVDS